MVKLEDEREWANGRQCSLAPAKRERKLDDISRNDQILLPIERGKFAVHLPREITERRRGEPAKMAAATCHSARARFPRDNKLAYEGSDHGNDHGERLTKQIHRGIRIPDRPLVAPGCTSRRKKKSRELRRVFIARNYQRNPRILLRE